MNGIFISHLIHKMPKTGISLFEKTIKEAGKDVRPAVKTLAGFRKAKRAKQALISKELLRIKKPLLKQNNGKLY